MAKFESHQQMNEKLEHLLKYEKMRDQQVQQQLHTKDLEKKLVEARLNEASEVALLERKKSAEYLAKLKVALETEKTLREQVAAYSEKFEQVQDTLNKSNDLFGTVKAEMRKMTKNVQKTTKEKRGLETQLEEAQMGMVKMLQEQATEKQAAIKLQRQVETLKKLCTEQQAKIKVLTASSGEASDAAVQAPRLMQDIPCSASHVLEGDSVGLRSNDEKVEDPAESEQAVDHGKPRNEDDGVQTTDHDHGKPQSEDRSVAQTDQKAESDQDSEEPQPID
jgi:chromosome segregation ATPase